MLQYEMNRICILKFYLRDVSMECGHPPVEVSKSFQETVKVAQNPEDTLQPVNVDHGAVSMRSSLEARSTFTNERNGQLFIEMSLMPDYLY